MVRIGDNIYLSSVDIRTPTKRYPPPTACALTSSPKTKNRRCTSTTPRSNDGALTQRTVSYIDSNLLEGERIVFRTRVHWMLFVAPVLFTVVVLLPAAWF